MVSILFVQNVAFGIEERTKYSKYNFSNYFLGIISANKDDNDDAFKYLSKVSVLKDKHSKFNIEYLRTLILLEKFEEAFVFSRKVWSENEPFFEVDLLLGIDFLIKKNYEKAEEHFERLNVISQYNLFFRDFVGNILISLTKASQNSEKESFEFLNKVPDQFNHITKIQKTFLYCHFDSEKTTQAFSKLIKDKDYNFERYNFFLVNYYLRNNKKEEAKNIIDKARKKNPSNLLLRHTENSLINAKDKKLENFFNCSNPKDIMAEFFYLMANLYATEEEYKVSNFYLKISNLLNDKFLTNEVLLAENYFYQRKIESTKDLYKSIKLIGPIYSWYVSKSLPNVTINEKNLEEIVKNLEEDFLKLKKKNYEHYYELANFYKDNQYFEKSIENYLIVLNDINSEHPWYSKILYRIGTNFERLDDWKNAEKYLMKSIEAEPDQPHVLNYLAYTWIDKGVNLDEGLKMLKKAVELKQNDGYILDSLAWAYYAKEDYVQAQFYLQIALELVPYDPIINDHYADTLWMLNKNIQARYVWKNILKLDDTKKKLKEDINKKLIHGISKKI